MKSFNDPLLNNSGFLHALGVRDSLEMLCLGWLQFDVDARTFGAHENGFADLLQFAREVREVMMIPESSQLFHGIHIRQSVLFYCFFHRLYRFFSFRVIGRAVTGKPLSKGN